MHRLFQSHPLELPTLFDERHKFQKYSTYLEKMLSVKKSFLNDLYCIPFHSILGIVFFVSSCFLFQIQFEHA